MLERTRHGVYQFIYTGPFLRDHFPSFPSLCRTLLRLRNISGVTQRALLKVTASRLCLLQGIKTLSHSQNYASIHGGKNSISESSDNQELFAARGDDAEIALGDIHVLTNIRVH